MDLLKLSPSSHLPIDMVEGWQSVIWTERYLDAGDCQIVTTDVKKTLEQIPIGTLLSHRQTDEVMVVQDIQIKTDSAFEGDGKTTMTVTGESFEGFLRHRVAAVELEPLPNPWQFTETNTGLVGRHLINRALEGGNISNKDVVPNITTLQSPTIIGEEEDEPIEFDIQLGQMYERVIEILKTVDLGLRTTRPAGSGPLKIEVYRGNDRTILQDTNAKMALRHDLGHFTEASYFFSKRDYKNVAYVYSPLASREVLRYSLDPNTDGLDRRVLYVDASDITEATPGHTIHNLLLRRGRQALFEHNQISLFEGKVSPTIPYVFKKDYDLGDLITVIGEYGFVGDMMVSEYILSASDAGEIGYPTLVKPPRENNLT